MWFNSLKNAGNYENYIKEAKYDMAVGHLLLKSYWSDEKACLDEMQSSHDLANYELSSKKKYIRCSGL